MEPGLQQLISLGVGGVVAAVVLFWKRQDDLRYQQELKQITERSMTVTERATEAMNNVAKAVEELCSLTEMQERLQALEKAISDMSSRSRGSRIKEER